MKTESSPTDTRTIPVSCNKDCGAGCPLLAHVEDGQIVKITNNPAGTPYMQGCGKGFQAMQVAHAPDRLLKPLIRTGPRGCGDFKEVPWDDNVVDRAIGHDKRKRRKMTVQRGVASPHRGAWHSARTEFTRVSGRIWEARMRTGVMHQIRVHAAFVGIPLLGDPLYGGGLTPLDAPPGITFFLHHLGIDGVTDPVPSPAWLQGTDA